MNSLPSNSTSAPLAATPQQPRLLRWQFGLRTLLLLITLAGVWTSYFLNRDAVLKLKDRIAASQPLANELRITDPTQAAVAGLPELWMDEFGWHYYLPPGKYQICLATRTIDNDGKSPIAQKCPLPAGKHLLNLTTSLRSNGSKIEVLIDGKASLDFSETAGWNPAKSAWGGTDFSESKQVPANQPIFLFRRRFNLFGGSSSQPKDGELNNGLLLWIEPVTDEPTTAEPETTVDQRKANH